jgi:assimilatory nitrate reductase catalytic subunit
VDGQPTHCPYCSLQCGIAMRVAPDRLHLAPQEYFPTNRGRLCSKGWTAAELLDHPQRLTALLVRDRRDAPLEPSTWDDALNRVVQVELPKVPVR